MPPQGVGRYCTLVKYFSPNLFIIKYLDNDSMLILIQTELWSLKDEVVPEKYPQVDQTYIVCDEDQHYKRAVCLCKNADSYTCWLIDYGVVKEFKKVFRCLVEIPDFEPLSVKAGLLDVVDSENSDFDFLDATNDLVGKLLKEATKLIFYQQKQIKDVHYGQLFLSSPNEKTPFSLIDYLLKEKMIIRNTALFIEAFETYDPTTVEETPKQLSSNVFEDLPLEEGIGTAFSERRFYPKKQRSDFDSTSDIVRNLSSSTDLSVKNLSLCESNLSDCSSASVKSEQSFRVTFNRENAEKTVEKREIYYPAGFPMDLGRKKVKKVARVSSSEDSFCSASSVMNASNSNASDLNASDLNASVLDPSALNSSVLDSSVYTLSVMNSSASNSSVSSGKNVERPRQMLSRLSKLVSVTGKGGGLSGKTNEAENREQNGGKENIQNGENIRQNGANIQLNGENIRQNGPKENIREENNGDVEDWSAEAKSAEKCVGKKVKIILKRRSRANSSASGSEASNSLSRYSVNSKDNSSFKSIDNSLINTNSTHSGANLSNSMENSSNSQPADTKIEKSCSKTIKNDFINNKNDNTDINTIKKTTDSVDEALKNYVHDQGPEIPIWHTSTEIPHHSVNNKNKNMITMGCSCLRCQVMNVNEPEAKFHKAQTRLCLRPELFLKTKDSEPLKSVSVKIPMQDSPRNIKIIPKILVHGLSIPLLNYNVDQVNFPPEIRKVLHKFNYNEATAVQAIGWPSLMRNLSLCLVGKSGIGKTFTYIPALCAFLQTRQERYLEMPTTRTGPIAIVLGNTSAQVEMVHDLFRTILREVKGCNVNVVYCLPPYENIKALFKKPVDILVTTPISLLALLKVTDLKRLCHLVVEDIDITLKKYKLQLEKLLNVVQQMLSHRSYSDGVQFICTAETWSKALDTLIGDLQQLPVICIANPMQAALYGRADIQVLNVKPQDRPEALCDILRKTYDYSLFKCIVVCKSDEVGEIVSHFESKGVRHLVTDDEMTVADICEMQKIWQAVPNGNNFVLLSTETAYFTHKTELRNANFLVNYSLPEKFSTFVKRFSCLLDSYRCPYVQKDPKSAFSCKVITFMDDASSREFPRIVNFFKSLDLQLPTKMLEINKEVYEEQELLKLHQNEKLCDNLKAFGECDSSNCKYRHIFAKDRFPTLPVSCKIKAKLISIKDVNKYYAKIVAFYDESEKSYPIEDSNYTITHLLLGQSTYQKCNTVHLDQLCLYFQENRYWRCRVTKFMNTSKTKVQIEGLDEHLDKVVASEELYLLPKELRKVRPALVELYVADVVPPHSDSFWSTVAKKKLIDELKTLKYQSKDTFCEGNVVLHVENVLWLDDLRLRSCSMSIETFSLRKYLKVRKLLVESDTQMKMLKQLCEASGIDVPAVCKKIGKKKKSGFFQVKPQWAHLEDDLNEVYFCSATSSDCVYIRLQKYYPLILQLEENIKKSLENSAENVLKVKHLEVGKCYLAKDPLGDNFCRCLVTEIDNEMVSCFFVDYGDFTTVHRDELKYISNSFIDKLPFQAIECRLYGVENISECTEDLLDVLYQVFCYEPKTDIYRPLHALPKSNSPGSHGNERYSIILLDYMDISPTMINKIIIDCGFGAKIKEESLDFALPELPEVQCDDEESSDDSHCGTMDFADFDFVFVDTEGITHIDQIVPPRKTVGNECGYDFTPMKTASVENNDGTLLPRVKWHQTTENVILQLDLPNLKTYESFVTDNQLYSFCTNLRGNIYKLDVKLFATVREETKEDIKGQCIVIKLEKEEKHQWPRLVESLQPMKHIKYNLDKFEASESETDGDDFICPKYKSGSDFSDDYSESSSDYDFKGSD